METHHDGHRKRLRQRFRDEGLMHFDDLNILELLLFYVLPRVDTNPIAHALIDRFGSLPAVLEAPVEDLAAVPGLGENAAVFLHLFPEVAKRYLRDCNAPGEILNTSEKCGKYLIPYFLAARNEMVYLLCLDSKCKALGCYLLHEGSVNNAAISMRKVVDLALRCNATSVVLAHNHTSGIALPSVEDRATTQAVWSALNAVGIPLVDHIVVAGNDFVSLSDDGFFDTLQNGY